MENSKTLLGLIGTVLLLAGFGGSQLLNEDQLKDAYVCSVTEDYGIFLGGVSGTKYTAYPYTENRTHSERCKDSIGNRGVWIGIESYAESKGVDPIELIFINQKEENQYTYEVSEGDWTCTAVPKECKRQ